MGMAALKDPFTIARLNRNHLKKKLAGKKPGSLTNLQRAITSSRNSPSELYSPTGVMTALSGRKAESPGGTTLLRTG